MGRLCCCPGEGESCLDWGGGSRDGKKGWDGKSMLGVHLCVILVGVVNGIPLQEWLLHRCQY